MSSRSKKIIGIIVAVVVLLLLLLVVWLSTQTTPSDITIVNTPSESGQNGGSANFGGGFGRDVTTPVLDAVGPAEEEPDPEKPDPRVNVQRLAASFAERYGSFSNQGDFENLKELRVFMTDSMKREVDAYIAEASSATSGSAAYFGTTTRSLSSTITRFNEEGGSATVVVNTQRQEVSSSGTEVYYQEIEIDFILSGEVWEVDSAEWQERD